MQHTLRLAFVGVMLLLCLAPSAAQHTGCQPAVGAPLRLGAIFPEGTLLAASTGEFYQGAQAVAQALNACGGVNGRPVEWVYQDAKNRADVDRAVAALQDEGISVIAGSGMIAVSERLRELAGEDTFLLWEVTESLSDTNPWTFSPRPTYEQLGRAAAEFALREARPGFGVPELRAALVYEDSPYGQQIARGVRSALTPVIELAYEDYNFPQVVALAEALRAEAINVVFLGAFDADADRLWWRAREADANLAAWIHIGDGAFRANACQRFVYSEAFISVSSTGYVSADFREDALGEVYSRYRSAYSTTFRQPPGEDADLSAAGVYTLLRHILPALSLSADADLNAAAVRDAILAARVPADTGFMGEGFSPDPLTGDNALPGSLVLQRQNGSFCSLHPASIATCTEDVQPFLTWRQRALAQEAGVPCFD